MTTSGPIDNTQTDPKQPSLYESTARSLSGSAGVKFWVVELGADGSYAKEEIQTVTVTLEAPVDRAGRPVKVIRNQSEKP